MWTRSGGAMLDHALHTPVTHASIEAADVAATWYAIEEELKGLDLSTVKPVGHQYLLVHTVVHEAFAGRGYSHILYVRAPLPLPEKELTETSGRAIAADIFAAKFAHDLRIPGEWARFRAALLEDDGCGAVDLLARVEGYLGRAFNPHTLVECLDGLDAFLARARRDYAARLSVVEVDEVQGLTGEEDEEEGR
ncbi:hypothetical protein B0T26DRAFT_518093 [Lasiosphaeria miniovina]|uniref:Uncharacterized protein n=1 Tax=Lasiosphaeria miniovina TaxID=1954250 RepID=A0AA39ZUK6_9PEZI|nr:uncharacterized protein B0T26DRAFT_518093 [Lasiosphaeria miniovina]KAK0703933.1 hypothetical protein B0T26DRAFT_518093 [Lasiosphaeria miniovina]